MAGEVKPIEEELKEVLEQHRKWIKSGGTEGTQAVLNDSNPSASRLLEEILRQHEKWLYTKGREGTRACLQGANLWGVHLEDANLCKAHLQGAQLGGAYLQRSFLHDARLEGATLSDAHLERAKLGGACLDGAFLIRAHLEGAWLVGANLSASLLGAHLESANLEGAYLERAFLIGANFKGAQLAGSNLRGADLTDAMLLRADLTNVDLTEPNPAQEISSNTGEREGPFPASELQVLSDTRTEDTSTQIQWRRLSDATVARTRWGMSNLTGAQLPTLLCDFRDALKTVEETSRNARPIYLSLIALCAFVLLTVATTEDAQLILDNLRLRLPIIGAEVPVVLFYVAAPVVGFFVFAYLHMYLQHLWELLAELPAFFPDGLPLSRKLYPWMINLIAEEWQEVSYAKQLLSKPDLPEYPDVWRSRWRSWQDRWLRFNRWRARIAILLTWGLLPLTIGAVAYRLLVRQHDHTYSFILLVLFVLSILWSSVHYQRARATVRSEKMGGRWFIPIVLTLFAASVGYYGTVEGLDGELPFTQPVISLRNAKLEGRDFRNANLAGADFSYADLTKANFKGTKTLEGAKFFGADMSGAEMDGVNLTSANLEAAKMERTRLVRAILQTAILTDADLTEAKLQQANLQGATLAKARLSGADLFGANLSKANFWRTDLSNIENWSTAQLRLANLVEVKNAPKGFWKNAKAQEAVCMSDEWKWFELREKEAVTEVDVASAQRECDRIGRERTKGATQPAKTDGEGASE